MKNQYKRYLFISNLLLPLACMNPAISQSTLSAQSVKNLRYQEINVRAGADTFFISNRDKIAIPNLISDSSVETDQTKKNRFDPQYELLSKAVSVYSNPKTKPLAEKVFDTLGYTVNQIFDPFSDGLQPVGLSPKDGSKPPVLVLPGGGTVETVGNPRRSSDEEFSASKQAIQDWIGNITKDRQANPQGLRPDVTGISRGGVLTQLTASEVPTLIGSAVTFVSPGIDRATADKFVKNGGDPNQVRHYITDGDYRSLVGDAFIPGKVAVGTYEIPVDTEAGKVVNSNYATRKHQSGIISDFSAIFPDASNPEIAQIRAITDKPADLTLSEISVDELNQPNFTWQGKDWQILKEKFQVNNPNLAQFTDRQNAEEVRKHFGAGSIPKLVGVEAGVANVNLVPPVGGASPLENRVNQPTAADDILFGTDGNDKIKGAAGDDYIRGGAGNDRLLGNEGKDALIGSNGNDLLNGGAGNDILTGGVGNDRFVFGDETPFNPASLGADRINDFTPGEDSIGLNKATFNLSKQNFASNFATVTDDVSAETSAAAIVYNTSNGKLFYNTNGSSAGLGEGTQFATLFGQPALSAQDFGIAE
jgi:serralysin